MANLDNLTIQINAETSSATAQINKMVSSLGTLSQSLSRLNTNSLDGLAKGIDTLTKSMMGYKNSKVTKATFNGLASSLDRLASVDGSAISRVASGVQSLSNSISQVASSGNAQVIPMLSSLAQSINALGTSNSTQANLNIDRLRTTLGALTAEMGKMSMGNFDLTGLYSLAKSISLLGSKTSTNAISTIPQLTRVLREMMEVLAKAPQVSDNVIRMTNAIADLAKQGRSAGNATKSVSKALASTNKGVASSSRGFIKLGSSMKRARINFNGLASALGRFYATCWLVIRAVQKLWKTIESSMDVVEVSNYFNSVINQVAKSAVDEWKNAGAESAEAYYNSFNETAQRILSEMSGFTTTRNGSLAATGGTSLGINPSELMNAEALFLQMSDSMGVAENYSMKLSEALSKLGTDLASVRNMEFKDVWDNLSSGLAGMSRAVDKFGINIRSTALDAKLLELGIDTTSTALTQAEKALLRVTIMLESSQFAWADLADTINTPANQLRMLRNNMALLGQYLGKVLLPLVANLLPYLNAMSVALQRLVSDLVTLMGYADFDWGGSGSTSFSDILSDILDDAEDAEQGITELSNAMNDLMGFDEINKLSSEDDGSSIGDTAYLSALESAFDEAYSKYLEQWQKAYDNVNTNTQSLATKIYNALKSAFSTGDWSDIGENLGNKFNAIIGGWDVSLTGEKIADHFTRAITFVGSFLTTADVTKAFTNTATIVSDAINKIFDNSDSKWTRLGDGIGETIVGIIEGVGTFMDNTNWANVFNSISESLSTMINTITSDSDAFAKLSRGFSDFIIGALDGMIKFLNDTDWNKVGQRIGDMFGNIEWGKVIWNLVTLVDSFANSLVQAIGGWFKSNPISLGITLGAIALYANRDIIQNAINYLFGGTHSLSLKIGAVVIAWEVGWNIGLALNNWLNDDDFKMGLLESISEIFKAGQEGILGDAIKSMFDEWVANWKLTGEYIGDFFNNISTDWILSWKLIGEYWKENLEWAKIFFASFGEQFVNSASDAWNGIKQWFSDHSIVNIVKGWFGGNTHTAEGEIVEDVAVGESFSISIEIEKVKDWFNNTFVPWFNSAVSMITNTGKNIINFFIKIGTSVSDWCTKTFVPWFNSVINTIKNAGKNAISLVVNLATTAKTWVTNTFVPWLTSVIAIVKNKAISIATTIGDTAKSWFTSTFTPWFNLVANYVKNKALTIGANMVNAVSWFGNTFTQWWGQISSWAKNMAITIQANLPTWSDVKAQLKSLWNNIANWINTYIVGKLNNFFNATVNGLLSTALGKNVQIFQFGKLPTFSQGGFPEDGLFFANHNELVGQFSNGRTAVANNDQIIEGIRQATYQGFMMAMSQNGGTSVNVTLQGDAKGIFKVVQNEANKYSTQTGRLAFT